MPCHLAPRGAADGAYTLVRRSDGQTYSFTLDAATDGAATAANIETALNAIEGVSGFTVKAKNDSIDTTMVVSATTDFGDFDIYKGGDIELESTRQTFSGIGGTLEWTNARVTANPGDYQLSNKTTGETFAFSIAESGNGANIDADELQTALNNIVGVSGFSVHTKAGSTTTQEVDSFDFGFSSSTDTTGIGGTAATNEAQDVNEASLLTFVNGLSAGNTVTLTINGAAKTFSIVAGSTTTSGEIGLEGGGNTSGSATATTLLADLNQHTGITEGAFTDVAGGSTFRFTMDDESGDIGLITLATSGAGTPPTFAQQTQGVDGDAIVVNVAKADGTMQAITLEVVASGTASGAQIASDATGAQLATALEANKGSAAGAFTFNTTTNKVDFTHTTAGQMSDSTGATKAGTAITVTNVDGTRDADSLVIVGNADFGDFDILSSAGAALSGTSGSTTTLQAGDINLLDVHLTAGNTSTDSATVQGSIELSSSDLFTVTQRDEETTTNALTGLSDQAPLNSRDATGSLGNDNYFTTRSAQLDSVAAIDLRTQSSASSALAILDGAIEKVSSMRSSLGAIENRLDHTVSNLMNISEQTESARSRIQDADFAAESAKLSKAQVLKQAGVGMLAQANASSQLVLQLLQ